VRPRMRTVCGAILVAPTLLMTWGGGRSLGDEPGRLGRLFRFGGSPSAPSRPPSPRPEPAVDPSRTGSPLLFDAGASATPTPRIAPRPRVSRAATEADPLVTRVSLGRSDDGTQFGMFLQVFADGTVLDSEGTHHVDNQTLKPLIDAMQSSDLTRLKGHCGAPATDFIEQVHLVVYERNLGRLRATSFSYSGNPQGCDHAVRHLHATLETLQAKISRPGSSTTASPPASTTTLTPNSATPLPLGGTGERIPLTPIDN